MVKKLKTGSDRLRTVYWSAVGMLSMMLISLQPVLAADMGGGDTIWNRFSTIMKDVYGEIVGISTIVGVTAAAIALIVRMISKNQRAVDEATSWLKRIVVTWIVLNSLGFIVAYLQPLIPVEATRTKEDVIQHEKKSGRQGGGKRCLTGYLKGLSHGSAALYQK